MRTAVHPTPKPVPWVGKRILICEDNCLIAMTFASTLSDTGYEVVGPVHTAEAAFAEAYRHLLDVPLIDIGLSEATDGTPSPLNSRPSVQGGSRPMPAIVPEIPNP